GDGAPAPPPFRRVSSCGARLSCPRPRPYRPSRSPSSRRGRTRDRSGNISASSPEGARSRESCGAASGAPRHGISWEAWSARNSSCPSCRFTRPVHPALERLEIGILESNRPKERGEVGIRSIHERANHGDVPALQVPQNRFEELPSDGTPLIIGIYAEALDPARRFLEPEFSAPNVGKHESHDLAL